MQPTTFAISTRSSAWRDIGWWSTVGHQAGSVGLDLDLSTYVRRRRLGVATWSDAMSRSDVVSTWIRAHQMGQAATSCDENVASSEIVQPIRTIVIQHDAIADPEGSLDDAISTAARLRATLDASIAVALAVSPVNPGGGREHLDRLQSLRHRSAEWDIHLALDLTGKLDVTWEAEAAILRIAQRLAIIRLAYPIHGDHGTPKRRLIQRVLTAAADAKVAGTFSIAPRVPAWSLASQEIAHGEVRQAMVELRSEFRARTSAAREHSWRDRGL